MNDKEKCSLGKNCFQRQPDAEECTCGYRGPKAKPAEGSWPHRRFIAASENDFDVAAADLYTCRADDTEYLSLQEHTALVEAERREARAEAFGAAASMAAILYKASRADEISAMLAEAAQKAREAAGKP